MDKTISIQQYFTLWYVEFSLVAMVTGHHSVPVFPFFLNGH